MGSWVYYRMQAYVSSEQLNPGLHACTVACALPTDSLLLFIYFYFLNWSLSLFLVRTGLVLSPLTAQ